MVKEKLSKGFTIIELLVSIAIFAILLAGVLGAIGAVTQSVKEGREKIQVSDLANNYLEIVRNMPYSQIGTIQGNPLGSLPDLPNAVHQNINGTIYTLYYQVNYIHDPADMATGTPDYKQVKMSIVNTASGEVTNFITTVVPKGLISNPNTGALQISVINAAGQPMPYASVTITFPTTSPYTYDLIDTTNASGMVTEVGLPAEVHGYRVVATEAGYSTDQTYPITVSNPNPTHPDATVSNGQVTQLTLSIDQLATLNIKTLNAICQSINGVNVNVQGSKLIGTSPSVYKNNNNYSSVSGLINLSNIEWDDYTPTLLSGQSVIIYGTSPIQQIDVLPNTSQTFDMILGSNTTANSLLVIVKDGSSGSALENASVNLSNSGGFNDTLLTGGSVWLQSNWIGGGGVPNYSTSSSSQYYQDNGNVNVGTSGQVTLSTLGGNYTSATGTLESSSFDTGSSSTSYTILSWAPSSQSPSTTLEFQVAANNDNATWNYVGPDGTANTYFTTPGQDMPSMLNGNEFFRYKAYLLSTNPHISPTLTSVASNFVTGCFTPGQVIFTGLSAGNYNLSVSLTGYSTQNISNINVNGNQSYQVNMNP